MVRRCLEDLQTSAGARFPRYDARILITFNCRANEVLNFTALVYIVTSVHNWLVQRQDVSLDVSLQRQFLVAFRMLMSLRPEGPRIMRSLRCLH